MKARIIFVFTALALAACNSPKEKALRHISELEANDSTFSPQAIEESKKAYLDFADKYPDDELAPEFIFKAAQRCNVVAQHEEAIGLFETVISKYPKSRVSEEAMFLKGYIYENSLHNDAMARRSYNQFIEKYPNSELAEDAKMAIENLGRTPEEIMQRILEKNKETNQ